MCADLRVQHGLCSAATCCGSDLVSLSAGWRSAITNDFFRLHHPFFNFLKADPASRALPFPPTTFLLPFTSGPLLVFLCCFLFPLLSAVLLFLRLCCSFTGLNAATSPDASSNNGLSKQTKVMHSVWRWRGSAGTKCRCYLTPMSRAAVAPLTLICVAYAAL